MIFSLEILAAMVLYVALGAVTLGLSERFLGRLRAGDEIMGFTVVFLWPLWAAIGVMALVGVSIASLYEFCRGGDR